MEVTTMSNKQAWQRRKHRNVKPNFMVRSIYNVVDWLSEFGDIVKATKRGTGYMVAVTVSTLITLSILIASTIHSITLLEHAGLHGGLQYVMLLPFEILFLSSSSALNKSILQGKWFPLFPWAGFAVSLIFIWRSNVTGLAPNIDGQVLAWSTPFLLLISKGLLGWYVKNGKAEAKDSRTEVEPAVEIIEDTEQKPDEKVEENPVPETIEPITLEDEKTDEIINDISPESIEENPEPAVPNIEINSDDTQVENPEDIQIEDTPEIAVEKVDENPEKISKPKRKRTKASTSKKKPKKSKKNITTDIPTIIAVAKQLESAGIFSRAELERQANTTTHYAKKAIAELEQTKSKNPSDIQSKFSVVAGGRN
jgi:hypothetical protein